MKALDTNILIRFLVRDDERQSIKVKALFEKAERQGEQFLISIPVVLEIFWVLEYAYDCSRSAILDSLEQLTLMKIFQFEASERVKDLITVGRACNLDLSDILIGLTSWELGCETTITFDKRSGRSELFQLPG